MTAQLTKSTADTKAGQPGAIPRLEGIRGVFALGVVTYHVAYTAGISLDGGATGLRATLLNGLQVCLAPFFVLSGMLLFKRFAIATLTDGKRPAALPFYAKRALRILPAYWAMTIILLLTLNFYSIHSVWYVLNPMLLIHYITITSFSNWIIGMEPTWTVLTEFSYYLLLPLVAMIVHKYARRVSDPGARARRMLVPITLFGLIGIAWNAFAFWPSNVAHAFYYNFWPFGFYSVVAAGMALGTLAAYAEVTGRTPGIYRFAQKRPNMLWLLALGIFIISLPTPFGTPGKGTTGGLVQELVSHVLLLAFAVAIITPLSVPNVRSRLMDVVLTNRPIRYIGGLSYAIYLWHVALIHVWFKNGSIFGRHHPLESYMLVGKVAFWKLELFVVITAILVATASRYLVEQPAVRLRNKLMSGADRKVPKQPGPVAVQHAATAPQPDLAALEPDPAHEPEPA